MSDHSPADEYVPVATVGQNGTECGVAQFFGADIFEHYQGDGYFIVATSDATAIRLEPGDFIVKRKWSTGVMPYIYNAARISTLPGECEAKP